MSQSTLRSCATGAMKHSNGLALAGPNISASHSPSPPSAVRTAVASPVVWAIRAAILVWAGRLSVLDSS